MEFIINTFDCTRITSTHNDQKRHNGFLEKLETFDMYPFVTLQNLQKNIRLLMVLEKLKFDETYITGAT